MDLSVYINYLLKKKDQAIIPGLGIFNLIKTPASFEEKSNTYSPPSSHIEFTQMADAEDSEIAMLISLYENVTSEVAAERTRKIAESIHAALNNEGSYTLTDIGKLIKDENGWTIFSPDVLSSSANAYYGMPKVVTENSAPENQQASGVLGESSKKELKAASTSMSANKIVVLAFLSVFLVSIFGCVIYIAFNYKESTALIHKKAELLNDFFEKLFPSQMKNTDTLAAKNNETLNSQNNMNKSVTDTMAKLVTDTLTRIAGGNAQSYIIEPGSEKKYFIIAGCFRDLDNAGKMIKDLEIKNYKPVIAGKTPAGLYRVCYSEGFTSKRDATDEIIKIRLVFKNEPWLIEY